MGLYLCINRKLKENKYGGFEFESADREFQEYSIVGLAHVRKILDIDIEYESVVSGHPYDAEDCWRPKNFADMRAAIEKFPEEHNREPFLKLFELLEKNPDLYIFNSY